MKSEKAWQLVAWFALSLVFTWPLGDLTHPVLPRHDDPLFSVWRLAWVAHQLPRDVIHLFDANIFFPVSNTLAYSDAMLLLGLTGAPLIWLGVHPLIVHNLLVIAAFATAGAAMARLVRYFTPSRAAQVTAGVIFAFAPYRVAHIVHLELLWTAFLPLALLALYRMLERPSIGRALWFGAAVGLQGLCSVYYVVFLAIWLAIALLLAPLHIPVRWSRRHLAAFGVSVITAGVLLSPYVAPYSSVRRAVGPRAEHEVEMFSARLSDYLRPSPHNRLYRSQPTLEQDERSLFLGAIALTLCAIGVFFVRSRTTTVFALLTLFAVDLSLGVNGLEFPLLRSVLPVLDGLRAPARFAVFALLRAALLAGLGAARVVGWLGTERKRLATSVLAMAIVAEYWAAPITSYEAPVTAGQAHRWLAGQPPTVVAALPMPSSGELWGYEPVFQYLSIFHWQPMVNGYSGHAPAAYIKLVEEVQDFPSDRAVNALRDRGVQVVLLHERFADPGQFDRYLYGCHHRAWFADVLVFQDFRGGRSAVCRLAGRAVIAHPGLRAGREPRAW